MGMIWARPRRSTTRHDRMPGPGASTARLRRNPRNRVPARVDGTTAHERRGMRRTHLQCAGTKLMDLCPKGSPQNTACTDSTGQLECSEPLPTRRKNNARITIVQRRHREQQNKKYFLGVGTYLRKIMTHIIFAPFPKRASEHAKLHPTFIHQGRRGTSRWVSRYSSFWISAYSMDSIFFPSLAAVSVSRSEHSFLRFRSFSGGGAAAMRKILFFRSDLKSVEKIPLRIVKKL